MTEVESNKKAITCLLARREYLESKIAERQASVGRVSPSIVNEVTAIDYAVTALNFVIQTIEYEAAHRA